VQIWVKSPLSPQLSIDMQQALGDWRRPHFDFHLSPIPCPSALEFFRNRQQDALQFGWPGYVAGTDGCVDYKGESMGAGCVMGVGEHSDLELSFQVGGPLSSLRAEAASMCTLITKVPDDKPLLVMTDSLALLLILRSWGSVHFIPAPDQIVHFDIIVPLLLQLRNRASQVCLLKVKSHSGCLLNDRADFLASQGRLANEHLYPGPSKHGVLHLRQRIAEPTGQMSFHIPERTPNKSMLKEVLQLNVCQAIRQQDTTFVRNLLQSPPGVLPQGSLAHSSSSAIRCWIKAVCGIYPTADYLHRIKANPSSNCPFCLVEQDSLAHFTCFCPRFHHARTKAHNRCWSQIMKRLQPQLPDGWTLLVETPMCMTGLEMQKILITDNNLDNTPQLKDLRMWRPDAVAINTIRKQIGILDLYRCSDSRESNLIKAHASKIEKYTPLKQALINYSRKGWVVRILPWVVGIRGFLHLEGIRQALVFLDIPRNKWTGLERCISEASIDSLAFMHRARFAFEYDQ
jgi:ribonuclease HI